MTTALFNFFGWLFSLSWLTGPIFDKELRVSSRRRRNYVLRFAYLAFLTGFLALIWVRAMQYSGSSVYRISRMAQAGQAIIAYTVWFQFCVTQVVAVIMLSTSVSDEIYNRTLGLLMTTPISSFQIVMGKLFSKLLQLVLLLAISLPLLATVRVFGGVPWSYVISSLCITLTTVIFVGSLSLFFSIFARRAYVVIIVTCLTVGILFAGLPLGLYGLWDVMGTTISERSLLAGLFLPNPYCNLFLNTTMMIEPRAMAGAPVSYWPLHCGIMLAASAVVLSAAVITVRKVALRQATGQLGVFFRKRRAGKNATRASTGRQDFTAATRRVIGPPVLWKELRFPMLGRRKAVTLIAVFIALVLLLITYALCAEKRMLDDEETHMLYTTIFLGLGMLFTIVIPSTCITSEKESRSWPLLLATTLDDREILFGKFVGIQWRCLPAWLFMFGHIMFFTLSGLIHPVAVIQVGIVVAGIVVFLSGTGLYFSIRAKHTTTAVMMNFALAAAIWIVLPFLIVLVAQTTRGGSDLVRAYMTTHPLIHTIVIMTGTADGGALDDYDWMGFRMGVVKSTIWMLACMVGHMSLGLLFAWRAKCRFRRNIF
jgi:ABC-type transport system involved in multi-copper enzyme maturation permease subunit